MEFEMESHIAETNNVDEESHFAETNNVYEQYNNGGKDTKSCCEGHDFTLLGNVTTTDKVRGKNLMEKLEMSVGSF